MKNGMKIAVGLLALVSLVVSSSAQISASASTGTTSATVNFAAGVKPVVKAVSAYIDSTAGTVTFAGRTGNPMAPAFSEAENDKTNWLPAASATNFFFEVLKNYSITNGDTCIYSHTDGTADGLTVGLVVGTNITFSAGTITKAGVVGDKLYEVAVQYRAEFITDVMGGVVLTNAVLNYSGDAVYVAPGDSPVQVKASGGAAITRVSATVER